MLYVGVDIAKYKHDIAIIDSEGIVHVRHLKIENSREGFAKLHMTLCNLKKVTEQEIQVAMEDTGHYCLNLLRFLRTNGYPTFSYNPLLIKEFAKAHTIRKTKTDKKDALTIAQKLRGDLGKQQFDLDPIIVELKYATRNVDRIKRNCAYQKTQFTRLLDIMFPELAVVLSPKNKNGHQSNYIYQLLKEFPGPRHLATAHLTKLTRIITQHSRGKCGKERALAIRQAAHNTIGQVSEALEFELLQTIDIIAYLTMKRKEAEQEVEKIMKQLKTPLLSVPGIGTTLASVILAEIRNIDYFKSPNQLLAFAGAEPSVNTSGQKQTVQGKMVKRGSPQLRWALQQAARLSIRWSPSMKQYMDKKLSEGKQYNVALSHVVKKLTRIIFHMLKYHQCWDEEKVRVTQ